MMVTASEAEQFVAEAKEVALRLVWLAGAIKSRQYTPSNDSLLLLLAMISIANQVLAEALADRNGVEY